jgi:predicted O-linked N-acetylglucosamine transferase (SPINDLY family)
MRRRLEGAFSRFIDVTSLADAEVERIMRDLHVDIAVDLSGHTLGQRTGIFAARAAPVQVSLLGLPATMGATYIDYLIADPYLVPGSQWKDYAEQLVWLPCFQPNDDRRPQVRARSRGEYGLPDTAFVFGSFNAPNKLSPACFDVWMNLLQQVDVSVLWILADSESMRTNLRHEAQRRGVDPARLLFAGRAPYGDHLARLSQIDLFLDSFPFNGGTTTSDALSVGVPVLTCAGESFSSRMSGSVLTYLGLPELITKSLHEYETAAREFALDPERLRELRRRLAVARCSHRFFDTDHYRVCLEAAYQHMHVVSVEGLLPHSFAVPSADH